MRSLDITISPLIHAISIIVNGRHITLTHTHTQARVNCIMRFSTALTSALAVAFASARALESPEEALNALTRLDARQLAECSCVAAGTCGCKNGRICHCAKPKKKDAPCVKTSSCGCSGGLMGTCCIPDGYARCTALCNGDGLYVAICLALCADQNNC